MMMYMSALFILFCAFVQLSCKGEEGPTGPPGTDATSAKQIRIQMDLGTGTCDTIGLVSYPKSYVIRFSPLNYGSLDSIIFCANLFSGNSNAHCIAELYNITDSLSILKSSVSAGYPGSLMQVPWVLSGNILNSFPDKEITLAVRVRTDQQGMCVEIDSAVLLLYLK